MISVSKLKLNVYNDFQTKIKFIFDAHFNWVYNGIIIKQKGDFYMAKTKTCVCLSANAKKKLEVISNQRNLSQSALIEKLILRAKGR